MKHIKLIILISVVAGCASVASVFVKEEPGEVALKMDVVQEVSLLIELEGGQDLAGHSFKGELPFLRDFVRSRVPSYVRWSPSVLIPMAARASPGKDNPATVIAPIELPEDRLAQAINDLRSSRDVVGVYTNPLIVHVDARSPAGPNCPDEYFGGSDEGEVLSAINAAWLRERGMDGSEVLIAIVDEGFDIGYIRVRHPNVGFNSSISSSLGSTVVGAGRTNGHGTMSAFLATVAAPRATLVDLASYRNVQYRSDAALAVFDDLRRRISDQNLFCQYKGLVVSNSWETGNSGVPREMLIGCGGNGIPLGRGVVNVDSPCHPLNRKIDELAEAGADMVFAAGNAGLVGGNCVVSGIQGTIHGPNSHPQVLTVAAMDLGRNRIRHSSYGPGDLSELKPDISGFSNFDVSKTILLEGSDRTLDQDTSAATALVAGIIAALRSGLGPPSQGISPAKLRQDLRDAALESARNNMLKRASGDPVFLNSFDREFGWGPINLAGLSYPLRGSSTAISPCMADVN